MIDFDIKMDVNWSFYGFIPTSVQGKSRNGLNLGRPKPYNFLYIGK